MPTFSIAIPAFKSRFLSECIDSILHQSFADFELIVADDCSPEPIGDIVRTFSDRRISYYRNPTNIGGEHLVDHWNGCLRKATGRYFMIMGDDDKLEPTYLEEFLRLQATYPGLDVYHCRSLIINEDSTPYSITPINPEFENIYDYLWSCMHQHRQQYISDFVYRTEALKACGGFYKLPLAWASDYVSAWMACARTGIAHTNKPVFNYRANQWSITSASNPAAILLKARAMVGAEHWIARFLALPPANALDALKHALIQSKFEEYKRGNRVGLVRQLMGAKSILPGLLHAFKIRKDFAISPRDMLLALLTGITSRVGKGYS